MEQFFSSDIMPGKIVLSAKTSPCWQTGASYRCPSAQHKWCPLGDVGSVIYCIFTSM